MNAPNLPAFLLNAQPSRLTDTLGSNLGGGSPPYVSIAGGRLTLIDSSGDEEPVTTAANGIPYLDCVIVDAGDHASKIYYGRPYDPNAQSFSPPDCWSDNGLAPSINASLPQARSCAPDPTGTTGCKWAVWGSATSRVSGKGVPACAKYQKLALLIPGDDVIFLLRVPPNSLDNLRAYNAKFRGQQVGIESVITRVSFEKDVLGTLTFQAVSYIDEDTYRRRQQALAQKATDALVGRGDQPRQDAGVALPPPAAAPLASAPQAPAALPAAAPPAQLAQFTPPGGAPPVQNAPPASPSSPAPGRRRRRTQAEIAAAQAPASTEPARAPFLPAAQAPVQPAGAPAAQFGIVQNPGVAPDPALAQALDGIFGPART